MKQSLDQRIDGEELLLSEALFQYQLAQFHYDYASAQLDIYKGLYIRAKARYDRFMGIR